MKDFENSFKAINEGLKEKTLTQIKAKDLNEHALSVFKCYFRDESPESYQIYTYKDYTIFDIGIPKLKYLGTYPDTNYYTNRNPYTNIYTNTNSNSNTNSNYNTN